MECQYSLCKLSASLLYKPHKHIFDRGYIIDELKYRLQNQNLKILQVERRINYRSVRIK